MGVVEYHNEITKDNTKTTGGGYYHVDTQNKKVYLYSKSLQYSRAKVTDVIIAVKSNHIPSQLKGYTFYYSYSDNLNSAMIDCIKLN